MNILATSVLRISGGTGAITLNTVTGVPSSAVHLNTQSTVVSRIDGAGLIVDGIDFSPTRTDIGIFLASLELRNSARVSVSNTGAQPLVSYSSITVRSGTNEIFVPYVSHTAQNIHI